MRQHYLQHGHADTRTEVKNKGSSIFGLPWHLHGRTDGRAEDKNMTRDCSVEIQANTGPNTAVLKAVLNTLNSTTINSFQILKKREPSFDKNRKEPLHKGEERNSREGEQETSKQENP